MKVRDFIVVTKPGIVMGNLLAVIGGFFVATESRPDFGNFAGVMVGTGLVIAGSCVVNNYLDRDMDARMRRTARRVLVTGQMSGLAALLYATALLVLGFAVLLWHTNILTSLIGLVGAIGYITIYDYAKRHTHHATLIGSIPGATPLVAGYTAVTSQFDAGAVLLAGMMIAWQMTHFYAIAIVRLRDYKAAGVPVLPAVKSMKRTVFEMRFYAVALVAMSITFAHIGYAGFMFGLAMTLAVGYWFLILFNSSWKDRPVYWGKKAFRRSLLVLCTMALFLSLAHVLL